MLLHLSQVSNHLLDPLRSLTRFDRLDIIPQLIELPDGPSAERPGRLFPDQFIENVHDAAELLTITVRCNNVPLRFR